MQKGYNFCYKFLNYGPVYLCDVIISATVCFVFVFVIILHACCNRTNENNEQYHMCEHITELFTR